MKKLGLLLASMVFVFALNAQTPPAKKECCKDKAKTESCTKDKKDKKCCKAKGEKKGEAATCCADKKKKTDKK